MIEIKSEVKGIFCNAVLVNNISGGLYTNIHFSSQGTHINFEDYKVTGMNTEKITLVNKQDPKDVIEIEISITVTNQKG